MRILIVEDEERLSRYLAEEAARAGYVVDRAADGPQADFLVFSESYTVIVLDLGLPGTDGLALLRRWRAAQILTPVLILTARGSWHEKVTGIDAGADDYVAKPFQVEEVMARIRALIRRAHGVAQPELRCGDVTLHTASARVTLAGTPVKLTSHEYLVLSYLMHRAGKVVSRSELTEHIYAQDSDRDSNTVEVFIARLRRKLGGGIIETIRGLGYRLSGGDGA